MKRLRVYYEKLLQKGSTALGEDYDNYKQKRADEQSLIIMS